MTSMDLQGIGAVSAATVALLSVPANMLVGRWQMKAALRAAEAAHEAGLAQAESAYHAALDAVGAEANAALLQWRRGIQREAYASFLLAANRVKELGGRFVQDSEGDLPPDSIRAGTSAIDDALAALKAAQTIIELEGPDEVAVAAVDMTDSIEMMNYYLGKQAIYERAWGKLGRIMNDNSPSVSAAARGLMQNLADLNRLSFIASSEQHRPHGEGARAAEQSCHQARSALPPNTLDDEEFNALLEGWRTHPPTSSSTYIDADRQFSEAETRFVCAARTQLHSPVTG